MSGHSKWSTIKRQKGAADIKRGQTFTKVANAVTVAVKMGGSGDPDANPRLRVALEQARAVNMPKGNIQRAIDRGLGKTPTPTLEEVIFEGFGPGKVAYYIESLTDNKMRTLQGIRNLFDRSGGSLGGTGSTSYLFAKKGEIRVQSRGGDKEEEILELIDLGAEEVEDYLEEPHSAEATPGKIQKYLVYTESPELNTMSNKLTQVGYGVEEAGMVMTPLTLVEIKDPGIVKKVLEFTEKLEEMDDIQKIYANFDIPEELVK